MVRVTKITFIFFHLYFVVSSKNVLTLTCIHPSNNHKIPYIIKRSDCLVWPWQCRSAELEFYCVGDNIMVFRKLALVSDRPHEITLVMRPISMPSEDSHAHSHWHRGCHRLGHALCLPPLYCTVLLTYFGEWRSLYGKFYIPYWHAMQFVLLAF